MNFAVRRDPKLLHAGTCLALTRANPHPSLPAPELGVTSHHRSSQLITAALTPLPPCLPAGKALKCHKCIASNENECNKQGTHSCPQYADACSTITAPSKCPGWGDWRGWEGTRGAEGDWRG